MNNRFKQILSTAVLLGAIATIFGCTTDENPVSPEKMSQIRKQEGDQRANFNPDMSKSKGN